MPRIFALVSIVTLTLAGTLALGVWPNAAAQDASSSTTAGHPVVGAWFWENSSTDPFDDSFAIFHADGTYVEETPYIGTGIGVWEATGERSADLIIVFQDIEGGLDPTAPAAFVAGTFTLRLSLEVDETGNAISGTGPIEIRTPDGALVDEVTFDGTGSRLLLDWAPPIATPAA